MPYSSACEQKTAWLLGSTLAFRRSSCEPQRALLRASLIPQAKKCDTRHSSLLGNQRRTDRTWRPHQAPHHWEDVPAEPREPQVSPLVPAQLASPHRNNYRGFSPPAGFDSLHSQTPPRLWVNYPQRTCGPWTSLEHAKSFMTHSVREPVCVSGIHHSCSWIIQVLSKFSLATSALTGARVMILFNSGWLVGCWPKHIQPFGCRARSPNNLLSW